MKAVDYLREKARMTKSCDILCKDCPLNTIIAKGYTDCKERELENPEKAVAIVEQWAKENPKKTYLSVLLEKFPNVWLNKDDNTPAICPHNLFGGEKWNKCKVCELYSVECVECWNREYKED